MCVEIVIVEATFMLSAHLCIRSVPTPQMYLLSGTKMKKEEKNEKTSVRVVPFGAEPGVGGTRFGLNIVALSPAPHFRLSSETERCIIQ